MRQVRFFILLTYSALIMVGASVQAQQSTAQPAFSFVAFGDMPYNLPEDYGRFENLIRGVNKQNQGFNVHVGDIKSSETDCSDAYYQKIHGYFNQFDKPLYVKGKKDLDNFTRLQTFGEDNIHAVKVTLNPATPGLFQIEPLMVQGN